MPKLMLRNHPDSPSPVERIEVGVVRTAPNMLRLTYSVFGGLDEVAIPPARPAARTDGLWKHSCFEAFLGATPGYYEFNFSPSSQWAAYRFEAHRQGMHEVGTAEPSIGWHAGTLVATFGLPADVTGRLGLSAVIEDHDGTRSFWALAHPPGPPDFHHAACFAAELPPAE